MKETARRVIRDLFALMDLIRLNKSIVKTVTCHNKTPIILSSCFILSPVPVNEIQGDNFESLCLSVQIPSRSYLVHHVAYINDPDTT